MAILFFKIRVLVILLKEGKQDMSGYSDIAHLNNTHLKTKSKPTFDNTHMTQKIKFIHPTRGTYRS